MGSLLRQTLLVSLSRYVIIGVSVIRNVVIARLLGPDQYHYWVLFLVALVYADQVHFGLRHAGDREFPLERGKGNHDEAFRLAQSTFAAIMTLTTVIAILSLIIGSFLFGSSTSVAGYDATILLNGLWGLVVIMLCDQAGRFFLLYLRTTKRFMLSSSTEAVTEIIRTIGVIMLGSVYGLTGMFVGYIASSFLFATVLMFANKPLVRFAIDRARVKRMFRAGFPMFITVAASVLIMNIDRVAGTVLLSPTEMSYYGFAAMVSLMPISASQAWREVFAPTIAERLGESGQTESLLQSLLKAQSIAGILAAALLLLVVIGAEGMIHLVLPSFLEAIPLIQRLSVGVAFFVLASLPTAVLIIAGRMRQYLMLEIAVIAIVCVLYITVPILMASKIMSFAISTAILFALYSIASMERALAACGAPRIERWRSVFSVCFPSIYVAIMLEVLHHVYRVSGVGVPAVAGHIAGKLGLSLLVCAPMMMIMYRRFGLTGSLSLLIPGRD